LEDATNINTSSKKMQRLSASNGSFQTKSNCTEMEFSILIDDIAESGFQYLTSEVSENKRSNESIKFILVILLIMMNFIFLHSNQI